MRDVAALLVLLAVYGRVLWVLRDNRAAVEMLLVCSNTAVLLVALQHS